MILAIALVGLALFLSRSQGFVVGASDQRAAVYLAEQMLEQQLGQLRSPDTNSTFTRQASGLDITYVCVAPLGSSPPCPNFSATQYYSTTPETLSTTQSAGWSGSQSANPLQFARFTCVQWVNDSTLQPTTGDGTPATDCPCTGPGTLSNTKRVCVKVTQIDANGRATANVPVVVLRSVLASPP